METGKFKPNAIIKNDIKAIHEAFQNRLFYDQEEATFEKNRQMREHAIMYYISKGDVVQIQRILESGTMRYTKDIDHVEEDAAPVGDLSDSPYEQALGILISAITLYTRAAVNGGLPENIAYSLSDVYINHAFLIRDPVRIAEMMQYALYDFTYEVNKYIYRDCSAATKTCCEYIQRHLHSKITLEDLAKVCHKSPNYVSDLFSKELGQRPMEFVRQQKLAYARNILETTEVSVNALAYLLAFPSPSAFITRFKEQYGITPFQYQKRDMRSSIN